MANKKKFSWKEYFDSPFFRGYTKYVTPILILIIMFFGLLMNDFKILPSDLKQNPNANYYPYAIAACVLIVWICGYHRTGFVIAGVAFPVIYLLS